MRVDPGDEELLRAPGTEEFECGFNPQPPTGQHDDRVGRHRVVGRDVERAVDEPGKPAQPEKPQHNQSAGGDLSGAPPPHHGMRASWRNTANRAVTIATPLAVSSATISSSHRRQSRMPWVVPGSGSASAWLAGPRIATVTAAAISPMIPPRKPSHRA